MPRSEVSSKTSTVKRVQHWRGWYQPRPAPKTSLILALTLWVSDNTEVTVQFSLDNVSFELTKWCHLCLSRDHLSKRVCWMMWFALFRSRRGSTPKNGVPWICLPCSLWILQVQELSFPHYSHSSRERLHLDPYWTHACHCNQRICWQQQLAGPSICNDMDFFCWIANRHMYMYVM